MSVCATTPPPTFYPQPRGYQDMRLSAFSHLSVIAQITNNIQISWGGSPGANDLDLIIFLDESISNKTAAKIFLHSSHVQLYAIEDTRQFSL